MKKKSNLSVLMDYAGSYKYFTYLSWILSAISAALALLPFYYIWKILKEIFDVMPHYSQATHIVEYGWTAMIIAVISLVLYFAALLCSHMSAFRVQVNLRKKMMHHIVTLPMGVLEELGSGKVRKTVNDCSAATETYLAHQLPDMVGSYVTPIGLVLMLFIFDWRLGLFCLVPVIIGFIVMMTQMTGPTLKQKMTEYQNALDDMSNEAVEYVRGIPVVKTFGQTIYSFERFKDSIDRYSSWAISYTKSLMMPMCFFTTVINGIFAFILIAGLIFTRSGITNTLILNVIFYVIFTPILTVTMTKMMFNSENNMLVADALGRMNSLLDLAPLESMNEIKPMTHSISIEHVSYSYDKQTNAVDDISLTIPENTTAAFVGPSGSGKSTLANLICRFFDVDKGSIKIGDVDVKDIKKEDLMNQISFVFQNSHLIKDSIYNNIKLSCPKATREEVLEALHKAQCDDIIDKFPQGIDTMIGSEGVYVSGGEQQRLCIARAILKDAPILVLDEATAYADPDNEYRIQQALKELSKNKTVIMIAHRLSTVVNADCIYVLDSGKVIESGSHEELMTKNGTYASMMKDYALSVDWRVGEC